MIFRTTQSASELDRAIKSQAVARLAASGLDLSPVAHQYYATILAVTGRARADLSTGEREALSKALVALGWRATEIALLCLPELPDDKANNKNTTSGNNSAGRVAACAPQAPGAYAQALNTEALVLLESNLLPAGLHLPWIKVATCDDFFGSLTDENKKRTAWTQLQAVRRIPTLTD